ncbi:hypothetical protein Hanom_Chr10g00875631 [Helianthus anomalus]
MELMSRMKMARFKPFGSRCEKTNHWRKVAKLAKPKWHFTPRNLYIFFLGKPT